MNRSDLSCLQMCLLSAVLLLQFSAAAQDTGRFMLGSDERVALIGDALINDEAAHGLIEHLFVTQRPKSSVETRNFAFLLSAAGTNGLAQMLPTTNSLVALRQRLDAFRPTIAVVGFGLAHGTPEAGEVTNALDRVISAVQMSAGNERVRFILLSPLRREWGAPPPELAAVNLHQSNVVASVEKLAVARGARFVNLFDRLSNERLVPPPPPLFSKDGQLTDYGSRRMAELVASFGGLWPPMWRFGVLADNTFRAGGYGVTVLETNKTPESARFVVQFDSLPMPSLPTNQARAFVMTPENRVQVLGLKPGTYDFKIDDRMVAHPTDQMLARSIAVGAGPQYDRAEQLRGAIVKKNRIFRELESGQHKSEESARLAAELADLKKRIAELRVPGTNVIEIVPAAAAAGVSP